SLLRAISAGDRDALDRLFALVYGELRGLARRQLGARSRSSTLQTTALVHETYLKLGGSSGWSAGDGAHFFALAGRAMRQIVIDHARRRLRDRRGAGAQRLSIDEVQIPVEERAAELLALGTALGRRATRPGRRGGGAPADEVGFCPASPAHPRGDGHNSMKGRMSRSPWYQIGEQVKPFPDLLGDGHLAQAGEGLAQRIPCR
ncbi:MAG: ECF-type sigma factor, partial [Candidatus Rokuibacteriota bacterium]